MRLNTRVMNNPWRLLWLGGTLLTACGTSASLDEGAGVHLVPRGEALLSTNNFDSGARWDAVLRVPLCDNADWRCLTLSPGSIDACGNVRFPTEAHSPNTLDACVDGAQCSGGGPSVNELSIATPDGTQLTQGKRTTITVKITTPSTSWPAAFLDLYATPDARNPAWTHLTTVSLASAWSDTYTYPYTPPVGPVLQGLRAALRFEGTEQPCTPGPFDDRDDLAFTVAPPFVPGAQVVGLSGGDRFSLVLREDGTLWGSGTTPHGELGQEQTGAGDFLTPSQLTLLPDIKAIASLWRTSFAVRGDGTVWAWGANEKGFLGDGGATTAPFITRPVQVLGLSSVVALATGYDHILALQSNGTVWSWGANGSGQLGDGTTVSRNRPVRVLGLTDVTALSAGAGHSLALRSNGTLWAWGENGSGQLGDGTTTSRSQAARVLGISGVASIAAGSGFSLAMRGPRALWAWGTNGHGQLANGTVNDTGGVMTPTLSHTFATGRYTLWASAANGFAVDANSGQPWVWGQPHHVCVNASDTLSSPTQIPGLTDVRRIKPPMYTDFSNLVTLFSRADGSVWGCGQGHTGTLGTGARTVSTTPVKALLP